MTLIRGVALRPVSGFDVNGAESYSSVADRKPTDLRPSTEVETAGFIVMSKLRPSGIWRRVFWQIYTSFSEVGSLWFILRRSQYLD
jgi:hypothetical protein